MCCQNTELLPSTEVDPQVAFDNFQKDCVVQQSFHMSYKKYMECIIDALIGYQSKIIKNTVISSKNTLKKSNSDDVCTSSNSSHVCTSTNPVLTVSSNTSVDCSLSIDLKAMLDNNAGKGIVGRDIFFPNKSHGHLTFSSEYSAFIGPDRQPVVIENIHQYLSIAETIKVTGVPNYISARIPIKSDLNLDAWEHHLRDYPDKRLLQYLKFGFPLSLAKSEELCNNDIVNHYSALQYPDQVRQYINKEMDLGAILGPLSHPPSDHFHCSPLLTRPKDITDRRIILNLSYPHGKSVNDFVDKESFDGSKFALKLPTIDDIVSELNHLGNKALLAKIDVARAFRN